MITYIDNIEKIAEAFYPLNLASKYPQWEMRWATSVPHFS
jgi:hypothetical protein